MKLADIPEAERISGQLQNALVMRHGLCRLQWLQVRPINDLGRANAERDGGSDVFLSRDYGIAVLDQYIRSCEAELHALGVEVPPRSFPPADLVVSVVSVRRDGRPATAPGVTTTPGVLGGPGSPMSPAHQAPRVAVIEEAARLIRSAARDRSETREWLENERNVLNNSFGEGGFRDGQTRDRIAAIDELLAVLPQPGAPGVAGPTGNGAADLAAIEADLSAAADAGEVYTGKPDRLGPVLFGLTLEDWDIILTWAGSEGVVITSADIVREQSIRAATWSAGKPPAVRAIFGIPVAQLGLILSYYEASDPRFKGGWAQRYPARTTRPTVKS